MNRIWQTIRSYIWWTHDRGSFHYDVMVTLILVFIFVAPRFIDFKDQPAGNLPHRLQSVTMDGRQETVYEVEASQVDAQDEDMVRVNFQRALRPIAGSVLIDHVEAVRDDSGHIVAYRAWVRK